MKAALISNFTLSGLDKSLRIAAKDYGIDADIYIGEYGQWQQEILGEKLYKFDPDIVYVVVDFEDIGSQITMIDQLVIRTSAKIVVCNQVIDSKSDSFPHDVLIKRFNDSSQVFVFDFDKWLHNAGKKKYWNTKYKDLGDMRLAPHAFDLFAKELVAYFIPIAGKTKKCLVLDLDNTLWGGIVGEDGAKGVVINTSGKGRHFYEFQKYIKTFQENGIILAINSNNNEGDAKEVFKRHKYMMLKEDDFAAERINWNNKAQNMREIAQELNIGLDSMVFVDDDPHNRELVRTSLPEVTVIDLPKDPSGYVDVLASYKGFTRFHTTAEDRKRAQMYSDEKKRRKFKEEAIDMESFLRGLDIIIRIHELSDEHIQRATQLTQKTNQFNLTTRRYQEEDIQDMLSNGARAWILDVKDKFGEYGLAGLAIIQDREEFWEVDTLLLSCRVLGKRVEEEFFGFVLDQLKKQNSKKVIAKYFPTNKNSQVKFFYRVFDFKKLKSGHKDTWELDLKNFSFHSLDFINTIT